MEGNAGIEKKVLVIGERGEFLAEGVAAAMKRMGYTAEFAKCRISDIDADGGQTKLYAMFVDAADAAVHEFAYLKEILYDKGIKLCLFGERLELAKARGYLRDENVAACFERPVDIAAAAPKLDALWQEAAMLADKKALLLVDDDPVFLRSTQAVLKKKYKVYMVNSGASAFMLMSKRHIDLILLDINMPVLDGPHVLEMIRSEDGMRNIPVMFLTGKSDPESIVEAFRHEPAGYIVKDISAAGLIQKLEEFFSGPAEKRGSGTPLP